MSKIRILVLTIILTLSIGGYMCFAADNNSIRTASVVYVNGKAIQFEAYNISGNNYFKLRDLAYALNGSNKQFNVEWMQSNNSINLVSNDTYSPVGKEMELSSNSNSLKPIATSAKLYKDGLPLKFTAYDINGNNYFKLRDITQIFDIGTEWDTITQSIKIDTNKCYEEGNTRGNLVNEGFVAEQNGWIYYSDRKALYKEKLDGTEHQKLLEGGAYSIQIIGNTIYYNTPEGATSKIGTNGGSPQKLSPDIRTGDLFVVGDWLYLTDYTNRQLYKMYKDGTQRTLISKDMCHDIVVVGDWIYYNNQLDDKLYKVHISGAQKNLVSNELALGMNIIEDWIYYYSGSNDNYRLYKMKTDGTNKMLLNTDSCLDINVSDGWIYCRKQNNSERALYKMKTDGSSLKLLSDNMPTYINRAGNYIYFDNGNDKANMYRVGVDGTYLKRVDNVR